MIKNRSFYSDFKQKYGPWAVVAGASEGLGAAFAEELARLGVNLVLLARRWNKLNTLADTLKQKYSIDVLFQSVDLADFDATQQYLNSLDVEIGLLVYNAAYAPIDYFKDVADHELDTLVSVNMRTPLRLIKHLSAKMISNKRGGIVIMSSMSGLQGSPKIVSYSASKAFLMILAEGLWSELKPYGIDVVGCCAGAIITPGYQNAQSGSAPGTLRADQVAHQALLALGNGPIVTPGLMNKIARFVMGTLLPKKWAISIMKNNTKNLSR
ncbi:MAG: short-chain dehydrogenase [Bacteroidetes bacterium]|nr:short-chain dehydrogenase [Bacteroidota bacterium]